MDEDAESEDDVEDAEDREELKRPEAVEFEPEYELENKPGLEAPKLAPDAEGE